MNSSFPIPSPPLRPPSPPDCLVVHLFLRDLLLQAPFRFFVCILLSPVSPSLALVPLGVLFLLHSFCLSSFLHLSLNVSPYFFPSPSRSVSVSLSSNLFLRLSFYVAPCLSVYLSFSMVPFVSICLSDKHGATFLSQATLHFFVCCSRFPIGVQRSK